MTGATTQVGAHNQTGVIHPIGPAQFPRSNIERRIAACCSAGSRECCRWNPCRVAIWPEPFTPATVEQVRWAHRASCNPDRIVPWPVPQCSPANRQRGAGRQGHWTKCVLEGQSFRGPYNERTSSDSRVSVACRRAYPASLHQLPFAQGNNHRGDLHCRKTWNS